MKTQLNNEIELIQHYGIRTLVKRTLALAPECFWTMPASTSGKHHPEISLGEGGLIRHTKAVVKLTQMMLETLELQPVQRDCAIAAAILHDCCKKADDEEHTAPDHPLRAAHLWIDNYFADSGLIEFAVATEVYLIIRSHMGRWNTSKHAPGLELPKPTSTLERLVHTADYLASRKDITIAGI